jgi:NhaP-type Na+/H+ or K+/H+ antiporter
MAGHGKLSVGAWVGIGMTAGAAFGVAIENIALGVGVGAAIGLAIGYLFALVEEWLEALER